MGTAMAWFLHVYRGRLSILRHDTMDGVTGNRKDYLGSLLKGNKNKKISQQEFAEAQFQALHQEQHRDTVLCF